MIFSLTHTPEPFLREAPGRTTTTNEFVSVRSIPEDPERYVQLYAPIARLIQIN